jgi:hypothetical protein
MSMRTLITPLLRYGIRTVRGAVTPFVNLAHARRREKDGLSKPITRAAVIRAIGDDPTLEIGPFFSPMLVGPNATYFDVLDSAALRSRATQVGGTATSVPFVEFVSPTGDLSIVNRRFPVVLSAHAVEHQPDLVAHLNDVANLLDPDGVYWLIVPDRRYSFDYPLPESTLDQVLEAHATQRKIHSPADVLAHLADTGHNNALLHWLGRHSSSLPLDEQRREHAEKEADRAARGEYVDVHAWIFSPQSFKRIVTGLYDRGLSRLSVDMVTETAFGKLEFAARLRLAR